MVVFRPHCTAVMKERAGHHVKKVMGWQGGVPGAKIYVSEDEKEPLVDGGYEDPIFGRCCRLYLLKKVHSYIVTLWTNVWQKMEPDPCLFGLPPVSCYFLDGTCTVNLSCDLL